MIQFDSPIPYYAQLKDILRERIDSGAWPPGHQLPSEAELCSMYGVSRTVVRQALQELTHEGLIKRRKGKGSFVASRKISEQLVQKLTGFYQDMVEQGHVPVTKVLSQRIIPAPADVAGYLGLEQGTPLIEIVRLRSVQDVPIVLVTTYLPYALCPDLINDDLNNQSLYALLETKYQVYVARGRRTIQAVLADGQEAKLLEVAKGAPLFRLDSISSLSDGRGVEYYVAYHRGDRSQFEVELIRSHDPEDELAVIEDLPPSNRVSFRG
ncbi:MAG: GntR family transcriptional regulator [Anaerolineae bacterium]